MNFISYESNPVRITEPLIDMPVSVLFLSKSNNLRLIKLKFATYNRHNNIQLYLTLTDLSNGNVVVNIKRDCSKFVDNAWEVFEFKSIKDSKDKEYRLDISFNGASITSCLALYYNKREGYKFKVGKNIIGYPGLIVGYDKDLNELPVTKSTGNKLLMIYSDPLCHCTQKYSIEFKKGLQDIYNTSLVYYTDVTEEHFKDNQVIYIQRLGANGGTFTPDLLKHLIDLIKKYRKHRVICYHIDDLAISFQNGTPIEFIKNVNFVLVTNENYLKHIYKYNQNIEVLRTFIDLEEIRKIDSYKLKNNKTNIMWSSTSGLGNDFMNTLIPEINKYLDCNLYFIGSAGKLKDFYNLTKLPVLKYPELISYIKSCDIILNPLDSLKIFRGINGDEFINCKSEIKYLLAASCRRPFITSKNASFLYTIKNGINGYTLENNIHEWVKTIIEILANKSKCDIIIKNAYLDILNNYLTQKASKTFESYVNKYYKML